MGAPGSSATEVAAGWLWSCCRPAFSSTDQTGRKRTITHSTPGTICYQELKTESTGQGTHVHSRHTSSILTHSPRSVLCSCSLAAYSAYDYDAATPSLQHQLSFSWLANEKKKSSPCLVASKIPKLYKILHHIESLNACMKY